MKIITPTISKAFEVDNMTYKTFETAEVVLGQGICAIKTTADVKDTVVRSHVKGFEDGYTYLYFITDLSTRTHNKTYIVDGHRYILQMTGNTPVSLNDKSHIELPILDEDELKKKPQGKGDTVVLDANEWAQKFMAQYKYTKYNDDIFFFDQDFQIWKKLSSYDDYNILISKHIKTMERAEKAQIMDSMQIYLYGIENVELDKNLLLFKNNKVLNIITGKVNDFDGTQFIINRLEANWYEDGDYPDKDMYLTKVLHDICGMNINANMTESKRRYDDLILFLGYMLTDMEKQVGIILYGKAQNGKSTVARLISKAKGSAFNIAIKPLINDPHYTSGFYNDRILFIDELKPSMVTEDFVSKYNQLLGNRTQSIREMQKAPRSVTTNFVTIMTANEISNQFFTNRALLRRTKVMNSMFPVVTSFPPHINLDDEVQKQDNIDWLVNHCIRAFIDNGYDISKTFDYDIGKWLSTLNPTVTEFMKYLVDIGLIDRDHNIIGDEMDFKRKLSMLRSIKDDMILPDRYDWESFDEQINIAFQFVFHMTELSCLGSIIRWTIGKDDLKGGNEIEVDERTASSKEE